MKTMNATLSATMNATRDATWIATWIATRNAAWSVSSNNPKYFDSRWTPNLSDLGFIIVKELKDEVK